MSEFPLQLSTFLIGNHLKPIWMAAQTRVIYQWLRLEQLDQWWHWLLLAFVCLGITAYVWGWYRKDTVELQRPVGWALMLLRLSALVGILLFFLQLDRRSEQRVVRESRVAILVDSSLSMTAPGTPSASGVPSDLTRSEEVLQMIQHTPVLQELAQDHMVSVYRFDQATRAASVAVIAKSSPQTVATGETSGEDKDLLSSVRFWGITSAGLVVVALLLIGIALVAQLAGARQWRPGGWILLAGACLIVLGLGLCGWTTVPATQFPLASLLGWAPSDAQLSTVAGGGGASQVEGTDSEVDVNTIPSDWSDALAPTGIETRMGDAIRSVLDRELGNPLAGIVVLTDGRSNAGLEPKAVLPAAQNARVPLYIVGLGSEKSPPNVQLVEFDVPRRLYPGDRFSLSALIGGSGFEGRIVSVQILSGPKDSDLGSLEIETEAQVELPSDGSLATVTVELEPKSVGEWQYLARIVPLAGDADDSDNSLTTLVEVIERKNRVLIFAGGPMREYQFVRNLLFRDKDVESHVLLQTGGPNTAQEAQKLLTEFPANRSELSQYDAIISFDADWSVVPDASVMAVEQWVAEQAGGLILVAGSVEMPKWLARSASGLRSQALRSLSPVVLDVRGSALLAAGRVESEVAWSLELTPEGKQTDFLWLSDDPKTSEGLWKSFPGVHTFYSAYELKPGAKALALFSDPTAAVSGQKPIYMASQFYGAGRVVFLGGSEMWRLRGLGDEYFDRYYTKLVRWVSQGRLLLDSDRGVLLVDREQAVQGEQVTVRAVLKNERYEPLLQSEVVARLIDPQQRNLPLVLRPLMDGSQPGVYTGQFPILSAGQYRLQLQLGGIASDEVLTAEVKASVPKVEMQNMERNDVVLSQLATESGGKYWQGMENAVAPNDNGVSQLTQSIAPQDQVAFLPGTPDREFQLRWLGWLMTFIASCLTIEWLARRVHRLA